MYRPRIGLVVSSVMLMLTASQVVAQPVAILPNTSNTTTTTTSSSATTPTPSASPLDLTQLNWRFGQLSPYAQQPLSSSATTQTSATAPGTTTNNSNLFVGSTLATQGSLISSGTGSTTPAATTASSGSTSTLTSSHYVSRFVTYENLVPTYGVTPSLSPPPTSPFPDTGILAGFSPGQTAIPEPTTLVMCGGLLALIGYGYSRRQLKTELKLEEKPNGETTEPASV
jgi:hypothetical protein